MAYDVFISYSRKDTEVADRICEVFDKVGISYFIDRQGIGGALEFPLVLAENIVSSKLFLFLASENSYNSKFTRSEIVFAFNKKEKNSILPYIIDNSSLPLDLEFVFAGVNWRNIKEHPIEKTLVSDMLTLLGRETQPKPASAKTYKVGDYYDDGKKQGVVFEVTPDGQHGKIVSLTESADELEWAVDNNFGTFFNQDNPSDNLIVADDKHNGANNMSKVRKIARWREKYPAFAWCADLGEGWYLPAIEELIKFTLDDAVHDAVNRTLAAKGKELKSKGEFEWYWSSTEYDEFCAWNVDMIDGYTYYYGKNYNAYVRAVSAF